MPAAAPPTVSPEAIASAHRYCRAITNEHAKTFSFALSFLPSRKHEAVCAVYAFCRYADDIIDEAPAGTRREAVAAAIARWQRDIQAVYAGESPDHPIMLAWADMLHRYSVREEHALELIEGVTMDLGKSRYATYEELRVYCHKVASVVGLMTIEIFGYSDPGTSRFAEQLGHGMQLTNIIRDIGEDAGKGRIYLPLDELEQFGCSEDDLLQRRVTPNFVRLLKFQIDRAREAYTDAFSHIHLLNRDSQLCVKLMGAIYADILTAVERNGYNVFDHRAFVPLYRKMLKVPGLYFFPLVKPSRA